MSQQTSIAIVGAGMGGMAAAGALRQAGFDVSVYEQAPAFARVGAGIQMNPNAVMALRGMQLDELLAKTAFEPRAHTVRDGITGEQRWRRPMTEEEYGAPYLCMHRADLHSGLASIVPGEIVHLGKELTAIDQDSDGVSMSFADGSTATADLVVAADGLRSIARDIVVGEEVIPSHNGRIAYRTVIDSARLDRDLGDDRVLWQANGIAILMYYIKRDKRELYFVTSLPEAEDAVTRMSWSAPGDVGDLRAWYDGFHEDVQAVLGATTECHMWPTLELAPLPRWHNGRVALLGDACHPMTPRMASGAALSIEDAAVLTRCLADGGADDYESAFARYEAHRKPRVSLVQAIASAGNAAGRSGDADMHWLYGYDAWATDLDTAPSQPDSVEAAV